MLLWNTSHHQRRSFVVMSDGNRVETVPLSNRISRLMTVVILSQLTVSWQKMRNVSSYVWDDNVFVRVYTIYTMLVFWLSSRTPGVRWEFSTSSITWCCRVRSTKRGKWSIVEGKSGVEKEDFVSVKTLFSLPPHFSALNLPVCTDHQISRTAWEKSDCNFFFLHKSRKVRISWHKHWCHLWRWKKNKNLEDELSLTRVHRGIDRRGKRSCLFLLIPCLKCNSWVKAPGYCILETSYSVTVPLISVTEQAALLTLLTSLSCIPLPPLRSVVIPGYDRTSRDDRHGINTSLQIFPTLLVDLTKVLSLPFEGKKGNNCTLRNH